MYNSYHSLIVFCSKFSIINPDFIVRLQVTILNLDSLQI